MRVLLEDIAIRQRAFEAFSERFPYAVVLLDPDLRIRWVSEGFDRLLGYGEGEASSVHIMDMVHPDDLADVLPMALDVVNTASDTLDAPAAAAAAEIPVRVRTESGTWLPTCISGRVLDDEGRLILVVRPAAERRALDLVLHELGKGSSGHSFDAIVELLRAQFGLGSAWLIHDIEGEVAVHGPRWDPAMGEPSVLLAGLPRICPELVCHDESRWLIPVPTASPNGLGGLLVLPAVRREGPSTYDRYVLERAATLAAVAFDRIETDRILRLSATTDYLTGLLNRRAFEERLAHLSSADDDSVTALFLDLDGFKSVNDSWGHEVGDEVLKAVAARVKRATRDVDIVARVGGDEFVVICRGLDGDEAEATRERLEAAVSQPVAFDTGVVPVSVSVGVSMARTPQELISVVSRSDQDMYRRKGLRREAVDCSSID